MTEPNSEIQREQQQLRQVIQEIEAQATKIESDNSYDGGSGVDAWADDCISKVIGNAEQHGSYLRRHLEKPYYSRLTFVDEGQVNDVYLGRYAGVYGGARLLDWRAPVAALMQPHPSRLQTYHVPTGATVTHRHVFLQRKRALDIATRNVDKINDLVEYTEADPGNEEEFFHFSKLNETFLLSRLEAGSEAALKDIVETIQTEQDALIRASLNQPLIVNSRTLSLCMVGENRVQPNSIQLNPFQDLSRPVAALTATQLAVQGP